MAVFGGDRVRRDARRVGRRAALCRQRNRFPRLRAALPPVFRGADALRCAALSASQPQGTELQEDLLRRVVVPDPAAPDVHAIAQLITSIAPQNGGTSETLRRRQGAQVLSAFLIRCIAVCCPILEVVRNGFDLEVFPRSNPTANGVTRALRNAFEHLFYTRRACRNACVRFGHLTACSSAVVHRRLFNALVALLPRRLRETPALASTSASLESSAPWSLRRVGFTIVRPTFLCRRMHFVRLKNHPLRARRIVRANSSSWKGFRNIAKR